MGQGNNASWPVGGATRQSGGNWVGRFEKPEDWSIWASMYSSNLELGQLITAGDAILKWTAAGVKFVDAAFATQADLDSFCSKIGTPIATGSTAMVAGVEKQWNGTGWVAQSDLVDQNETGRSAVYITPTSDPAVNASRLADAFKSNTTIQLPHGVFEINGIDLPSAENVCMIGYHDSDVRIANDSPGLNFNNSYANITLRGFAMSRSNPMGYGMISKYGGGSATSIASLTIDSLSFTCHTSTWNAITIYPKSGDVISGVTIKNSIFKSLGRMAIEFWPVSSGYQLSKVKIHDCEFANIGLVTEPLAISMATTVDACDISRCDFISEVAMMSGIETIGNTTVRDCKFYKSGTGTIQPFTIRFANAKNIIIDRCEEIEKSLKNIKMSNFFDGGSNGDGVVISNSFLRGMLLRQWGSLKAVNSRFLICDIENGKSDVVMMSCTIGDSGRPNFAYIDGSSAASVIHGNCNKLLSSAVSSNAAVNALVDTW